MTKSSLIATTAFITIFSIGLPPSIKAQEQKTLAVLEFDHFGIALPEAQVLTNRFRNNLAQLGIYRIIERGLMNQILAEQDFQSTGCTSDECAVEVGQLLGVQLMLAGSVGKIGNLYSFDLRIIDVATGHIIKTASHDLTGDIAIIMRSGMAELAGIIAGSGNIQAAPAAPITTAYGTVDISSTPEGATVLIDGEQKGTTPALSNRVTAGQSHTIQVSLDGYATIDTTITARQNSRLRVDLTLRQLMGWLTIEANVPSTVYLDNQRAGKTPLTRLEYGTGNYALKVSRPEYFPFRGNITIPQNNEARQSVVLKKKPKAPAMIMSLALPGSGQLYQGHNIKALVFGGAALGLASLAHDEQQNFDESNDDFIYWRDEYNNETDREQMAIKKATAQEALDAMSQAETNRNLYLGILGGIWTVNILDILF